MRPLFPDQFRRREFSPDQLPNLAGWWDVSAVKNDGNLIANSISVSSLTSPWTAVGTTTVTGSITDPWGGTTAVRVNNYNDAIGERLDHYQTAQAVEGRTMTARAWLKGEGANIGKIVRLQFRSHTGGVGVSTDINHTLTADWVLVQGTISFNASNVGFRYTFNAFADLSTNANAFLLAGCHVTESTWEQKYVPSSTNQIYPNARTDSQGFCINIRDFSGNVGRDLYQGTAANQPMLSQKDVYGNLFPYSESYTSAPQTVILTGTDLVPSANADAPPGFTGSYKLTESNVNERHSHRALYAAMQPVVGRAHKTEIRAKAAGRDWLFFGANTTGVFANFDLANGVLGDVGASATASISSLGNGWYLCTMFHTANAFTTVDIATGNASTTDVLGLAYAGDGTSGILIAGPSLRELTWPDEYIRTESSPRRPGQLDKPVLYFNGTLAHLVTPAFTITRPATLYVVMQVISHSNGATILDSSTLGTMRWRQLTPSPTFALQSTACQNDTLTLSKWAVISCAFDGASGSFISIDLLTPTTGDAGSSNSSGVILGANTGPSGHSRLYFAEMVLFTDRHDRTTRLKIQQYLARKWDLPL